MKRGKIFDFDTPAFFSIINNSLFSHKKTMGIFSNIKLNFVSLPDWGWNIEQEYKDIKLWINPEKTVALSLCRFKKEPAFPTIKNIDLLRKYYRLGICRSGGGIIEVNVIDLKGLQAIRTIFKAPQDTEGVIYIASLTLPFRKSSYVIKIEAPEISNIGKRDSEIAGKLIRENVITVHETGSENWVGDPYDPNFNVGLLMNRSEEPIYDKAFPEHPLSLVRTHLEQIETGICFNDKIRKIKKFEK
jgi:hypothetical protein